MRPEVLLSTLNALGVRLTIENGKLLYEGLFVTPLLQKEIEKNEEALIKLLQRPARARPEEPHVESSPIRFHRGISWTKEKQRGPKDRPIEKEIPSENSPGKEARELAAKLRQLLEPEALEKLKSMSPIQVTRWEKVIKPERFLRRTLFELETGRSQVLEAAKERAKRFLKIMEKQKAAQR